MRGPLGRVRRARPLLGQRREHRHDRRRPLVVPKRIDQRVDESVEPAPEIGFQLLPRGERSHRSARVHYEKDLIGGGRQIAL